MQSAKRPLGTSTAAQRTVQKLRQAVRSAIGNVLFSIGCLGFLQGHADAAAGQRPLATAAPARPNILWLVAEDMSPYIAPLEEDGLLEETIVVWFSDHGGPLPRQKRLLYDSGLRVPLIVRHPGRRRAGELDERLMSLVDFAPTFFSATAAR